MPVNLSPLLVFASLQNFLVQPIEGLLKIPIFNSFGCAIVFFFSLVHHAGCFRRCRHHPHFNVFDIQIRKPFSDASQDLLLLEPKHLKPTRVIDLNNEASPLYIHRLGVVGESVSDDLLPTTVEGDVFLAFFQRALGQ